MAETISPAVHGGRTSRYWLDLALHVVGAFIASAAVGGLLGLMGDVLGAPWGEAGVAALIAVGILYAIRDLFSLPLPLPNLKRQVPEWWRTFFPLPLTSFLYGLGLGLAFYTSLSVGTFVVVASAAFTSGDPLLGALLCAPFGLGRALVVAAADIDDLEGGRGQRSLERANGAVSLLIAASLAVVAVLP